jgi:hypothetical protein
MIFSDRILGTTTVRHLRERTAAAVLVIGKDRYTRADLARVACFNYVAAANLSAAIHAFQVKDTKDLFQRIAPSSLALPRVGAIALACLGAAFELKGLGGDAPLETWVTKHATNQAHPLATFDTIKRREAVAAKEERRAVRKARRQSAPSTPSPAVTDEGVFH